MNCCQIQGIEELFSKQFVTRELSRYRSKGPDKTTRLLTKAIEDAGVQGLTLLDIGGGVGAIQHELIASGVDQATDVDASTAYLEAARDEAQKRSLADRVTFRHGNFVDLAADIPAADIVTLDRVICCYPDMNRLVDLSAARARKLYGLVYPRETWWVRTGLAVQNFFLRMRKSPFRTYSHPTRSVETILEKYGLKQRFYRRTMIWQVAVYAREVA